MFELRPYRKNETAYYDPFAGMREMEKHFFGDPFDMFGGHAVSAFKTDITDNGDSYLLEADLPGFDKKDIGLHLDGDTLTIRAERGAAHEEKDKDDRYICRERSFGSYTRAFDVSGVDTAGIKAAYTDGVLRLTMPKKTEETPTSRTLEIE